MSGAVLLAGLCLGLRAGAALAQVSAQDCDALEAALSQRAGGVSDLDLVARDDLARRIERHGPDLGLTPSTTRLQALALRENDRALMAMLMADMPALQAAHALCLDSVAGGDATAGASDALAGSGAGEGRAAPPRRDRARIEIGAVPFSWAGFLGLTGATLSIALGVWGYILVEKRRRRRVRRHVCDLPARAHPEGAGAVAVRVADVSRLGCRVTPGAVLGQTGTRVSLEVSGLNLPGRIVWQNRHFCGLVFAAPVAQAEIDLLLAQDGDARAAKAAVAPRVGRPLAAPTRSDRPGQPGIGVWTEGT